MASVYPGQIDTTATFPPDATLEGQTFDDIDGSGTDHTTWMSNAGDAIIKIETELGTDPSEPFSTVKDRIDAKADLGQVIRSDATTSVATNTPDLERFATNPIQIFRRANGTSGAPSALLSGDVIGSIFWAGRGATSYPGFLNHASISAAAAGSFSNASTPTRLLFSTTPSGSIAATERMRITEKGLFGLYGQTNPQHAVIQAGTGTGSLTFVAAADQGAPGGFYWKQDTATAASGAAAMPAGARFNLKVVEGSPETLAIGLVSRIDEHFVGGTWSEGKARVALWGQVFIRAASALRSWGENLEVSVEPEAEGFTGNLIGQEVSVNIKITGDYAGQISHLIHKGSGNLNVGFKLDSDQDETGRVRHMILTNSNGNGTPLENYIWYGPTVAGLPSGTALFQVSPIGSVFTSGRLVLTSTANGYIQFPEKASAPGGAANVARLYARDNSGKTQLVVQWPGGAITPVATEP